MKEKSIKSDPNQLIDRHRNLIHSEAKKVLSHTMREQDDWVLHSLMIEDCDTPFKFKRKEKYQSLKGARVNMTYYASIELISGITFEVMNIVRIKKS